MHRPAMTAHGSGAGVIVVFVFVFVFVAPAVVDGRTALGPVQIHGNTRQAGQADKPEIPWAYCGGLTMPYEHQRGEDVALHAQAVFERWCGEVRLAQCLQTVPPP